MSWSELFRTLIVLALLALLIMLFWAIGLNHYNPPRKSVKWGMPGEVPCHSA